MKITYDLDVLPEHHRHNAGKKERGNTGSDRIPRREAEKHEDRI